MPETKRRTVTTMALDDIEFDEHMIHPYMMIFTETAIILSETLANGNLRLNRRMLPWVLYAFLGIPSAGWKSCISFGIMLQPVVRVVPPDPFKVL